MTSQRTTATRKETVLHLGLFKSPKWVNGSSHMEEVHDARKEDKTVHPKATASQDDMSSL